MPNHLCRTSDGILFLGTLMDFTRQRTSIIVTSLTDLHIWNKSEVKAIRRIAADAYGCILPAELFVMIVRRNPLWNLMRMMGFCISEHCSRPTIPDLARSDVYNRCGDDIV
jgi:hypothetical protein